ncbi:MAG: chromate transporter [Bradyrhizobium sp.]|nr:chromate transporter [Bradyrhizobium sp.]MDE2331385.1 chromate transporter [Bradyrhizobium sp.]
MAHDLNHGAPVADLQDERPSVGQIADVFVRYANFTLGGGSATTAVIHGEIVGKRGWVSEEQFGLSFALGRLTPGTNLLAFCTGIGWGLRRWTGAIVALLAASIPCTLFVVIITALFAEWQENPFAQAAIKGAIAAAVAVTVKTVWTIAHPHFRPGNRIRAVLIGATAFALHTFAGISPIDVLLLAVVIGFLLSASS